MSAESATQVSKQALRLWLRLFSGANEVETVLRSRLRSEFGVTLPQFDVLSELERAGTPQTMSELSRRLLVSNGNVTGVVDRLEREKLVRRRPSPSDRRVLYIELTPAGARRFEEMADAHEQWVAELFAGLDSNQLNGLIDGMDAIRASIRFAAQP